MRLELLLVRLRLTQLYVYTMFMMPDKYKFQRIEISPFYVALLKTCVCVNDSCAGRHFFCRLSDTVIKIQSTI